MDVIYTLYVVVVIEKKRKKCTKKIKRVFWKINSKIQKKMNII
jgi:hypothetical protein